MSPRTFVARSAAILSLAALGLAACESKTVVQPPVQSLSIVVSPAAVTLTAAGQKAQFVAVVTGGATTDVKTYKWSSSNTAVATVDQATGIVTAVANGVSTITATADADANVKSAGLVTVNIPVVQPPVVVPPTISIQSVTNNAGQNVLLSNVFGQINVNLNVDPGQNQPISKVEVLVDGAAACSQSFSTGSAQVGVEATNSPVVISCSINTAALKADGSPVYANGNHTITARLVGPTGNVLANPATEIFTFNNQSTLGIAVAASKNATNPNTGVVWNGGNITVTVTPAIFGLTGNLVNVLAAISANADLSAPLATKSATPTSNTGVLTIVFPDTMLQRLAVQGQTLYVGATSSTSAGVNGPMGVTATTMAIDEVAPVFSGTWNLNGVTDPALVPHWLNPTNAFTAKALGFDPASKITDTGVDNNTITVQDSVVGSAFATAPATAAALGEQPAATVYLRIMACDALGNCSKSSLSPAFGVDIKAPQLTGTAPAQINPAAAYTFAVADTGVTGSVVSGTPAQNVVVVEKVFTPAKTLCATDAAGTTADMPTSGTNANTCASFTTTTGTGFTVPAVEGYDSVYVFAVDSAGNKSATIAKLFLRDTHAPTISSILPTTLAIAGGSAVTFNALVQDNIDLNKLSGVLIYGAVVALQLPTQTLDAFGLPMNTAQVTASYTINPFVTSIQTTLGAAGTNASNLSVTVSDQANNSSTAPLLDLSPFVTDQSAFDFGAVANGAVATEVLTASSTTLCVATCTVAAPTADTLVFTITQPTGAATPFTSVTFYRQTTSPGAGAYTPIGTVTQGFISQTETVKTVTWKLVYTAAEPAAGGTYNFIAVGTDTKGHGLMSNAILTTIND